MKSSTLHKILTIVWVLMLVPTLVWWSNSLTWVLMISIYANIVSHWGAYEAAKGKEQSDKKT